jgi:MFS family permease
LVLKTFWETWKWNYLVWQNQLLMISKAFSPENRSRSFLILVASLGYFVDIYDLLIFSIVREPSLKSLLVPDAEIVNASAKIINWQMFGLLLGGILWGVMGDKRGRLSVLFGSILLYSIANFLNGFVQSVNQYAGLRFVTGIGLAGELGAGITLVSEMMPKSKRGIMTSFITGVGVFGAVLAYLLFDLTKDWRMCYMIGGGLGILLLLLRVSVSESAMFRKVATHVERGNLLKLFTTPALVKKYVLAILVGVPSWFIVGILITLSNRFAMELYEGSAVVAGACVMYGYIGNAMGDITVGLISQYYQSRKKALYFMYAACILAVSFYFSPLNNSDTTMYICCFFLGYASGFWAIIVTMGAEHFGTNMRATAATTIPNMVRGSLPLMNLLFNNYFIHSLHWSMVKSGIVTGVIVIGIALVALVKTEETFHKDLDYLEE